jgi:RHS repeat-associated protein
MEAEHSATNANSVIFLVNRNHDLSNRITSMGTDGNAVIRGTLSEPGDASVGLAGGGDKPARMLADNRFETELLLQPGSNSVAIAATDTSGNRSNYRFNVTLPSANVSPLSFTYDLNGNLTSDGMRSYEWDIHSRLKKVTWGAGQTTEFKYNALGQRCESTDTVGGVATKRFYLFDGIRLIDRRTGTTADTATIDRRYFSQGEQRKNGSSWENYFYSRDHLGSIREVVKSAGGTNTLVARYDYDPYGKRLTQYQSSAYTGGCDFGYTGHVTVPSLVVGQTELVLTHFRAYDPNLGRWLSADPIGEAGGMNLYAYVLGDPINGWDPYGLEFWSWNGTAGDWAENTAQFSMGMADNLSFGLNGMAREQIYGDDYSDPCSKSYKGGEWAGTGVSLAMGGAGAAKGLAKAGSSSLRKQLYEIGQKTLTNKTYRDFAFRNADPVRRGIDIVRQQGWIRASLPSPMGLLTQGLKTGATTGLTPLAADSLGAAAATGFGVGSAAYNLPKPSKCP